MGHPPPRNNGPEPLWVKVLRPFVLVLYTTGPALVIVAFLWLAATWWSS